MADSPEAAMDAALATARLFNLAASLGPTGRVIYPDGPSGGKAWVLARRSPAKNAKAA